MKINSVGKTGISVSAVGLGTVKFGRNQNLKYPETFELPSDRQILQLLDCARDLGISLLDTAPAYGHSEERLGKLLLGRRQQWVISTKFGEECIDGKSVFDFSRPYARKSIERSLQRLHTDYLDIVLVHSNGEDIEIIEKYNVFDTLEEMKQAGMIRAYGMSTKTIEGGLRTVAAADVVMVTYNPLEIAEQPVIELAHQQGKSIFIKKALASGHLKQLAGNEKDPVQVAMDFVFSQPGVSSVILGTLNVEHLKHSVQCMEKALLT